MDCDKHTTEIGCDKHTTEIYVVLIAHIIIKNCLFDFFQGAKLRRKHSLNYCVWRKPR